MKHWTIFINSDYFNFASIIVSKPHASSPFDCRYRYYKSLLVTEQKLLAPTATVVSLAFQMQFTHESKKLHILVTMKHYQYQVVEHAKEGVR